jgi:hypothetical protein
MSLLPGCGADRDGRAGRSSAWRQGPGASAAGSLALAGEQSCESRQNRPIRRLQSRSMDLASKDAHLMPQHDLDHEVRVPAKGECDELEGAAERPVEEREGHRRMLPRGSLGVKVQVEAPGCVLVDRQGVTRLPLSRRGEE